MAPREPDHLVVARGKGQRVVAMAFVDGIVVASVGLMLALIFLMAGAAIVLIIPEALMHWVRRQRNNHRAV